MPTSLHRRDGPLAAPTTPPAGHRDEPHRGYLRSRQQRASEAVSGVDTESRTGPAPAICWTAPPPKPLFEGKTVMRENPDPYAVLGVTPTATQAEITHAYRTQLRSLHPDTRHAPAQAAAVADPRLRHILAAYAALRDPHHRADDDRTAQPATTTQPRRSDPSAAHHTSPNPQGPVQIPINYHKHTQPPPEGPPLWAGPARHHH